MPVAKSFDKYAAYASSVQSPREDARFLRKVYRDLNHCEPADMREDFCGAFALCCEWVKLDDHKHAIGLDIDPEALHYGRSHYQPLLSASAESRLKTFERDVLRPSAPRADIICALNFSYFTFKDRSQLLRYFDNCHSSLNSKGLFIVDVFGGPRCEYPSVETKRTAGLTYFWEQESYDPINNHAQFYIHFKPKNGRKRSRVFGYNWRMWSIAEIRDIMLEVGFKDVVVYWEGTARNGTGSGKYYQKNRGEPCEVWLAYVVGLR